MKRLYLLICLCTLSALAHAQDSVRVWNKWCAQKDSMILFNTANNVIQAYSRDLKATDIKLKSLDNNLRIGAPEIKGDTVSVMAMPHAAAGKKMRLAVINNKTNKTIKVINFCSQDVPAPVAQVGIIKGSEASRKDILAQNILKCVFPNSLYSYPYRIRQYTFLISTPTGSAKIPVAGIFLSKEVLEQIKNAPAGTVVTFTDIKATCPECAVRTLDDIKLKIR